MNKEDKSWTAGDFWFGRFLQACEDYKSMRDEMESWRDAFKNTYNLRKDEIRKQKLEKVYRTSPRSQIIRDLSEPQVPKSLLDSERVEKKLREFPHNITQRSPSFLLLA